MFVGIEHVGATAGSGRDYRRRRRRITLLGRRCLLDAAGMRRIGRIAGNSGTRAGGRTRTRTRTRTGSRISLQRPDLLLELLIAVLQLLNRAGELTDLPLQLIDLHGQIGFIHLRAPRRRLRIVVAEQVVEKIRRAVLRRGAACQDEHSSGESRCLRRASKSSHVRKPSLFPETFRSIAQGAFKL
jgi:hypothetical protein